MQYFYRDDKCRARTSGDKDCICWRDKGTGPFICAEPGGSPTYLEWRVKPTKAISVPEIWSQALQKRFLEYNVARNLKIQDWCAGMRAAFPVEPIPLDKKIDRFVAYTMREARINAAKKLAGNDWPDEDY